MKPGVVKIELDLEQVAAAEARGYARAVAELRKWYGVALNCPDLDDLDTKLDEMEDGA